MQLTKLYNFRSNKYESLLKRKTKATWSHKIIIFFKSPSSKGSKFQAHIPIYINIIYIDTIYIYIYFYIYNNAIYIIYIYIYIIYINMLLKKTETGREFLQTLLPLGSTCTESSSDLWHF